MGIKFSAACTLEIKEYPDGIPSRMCTQNGDWSRYFPCPPSTSGASTSSVSSYSSMDSMASMDEAASSSGVRDISFNLVAGDFQVCRTAAWRGTSAVSLLLHYAYHMFKYSDSVLPADEGARARGHVVVGTRALSIMHDCAQCVQATTAALSGTVIDPTGPAEPLISLKEQYKSACCVSADAVAASILPCYPG